MEAKRQAYILIVRLELPRLNFFKKDFRRSLKKCRYLFEDLYTVIQRFLKALVRYFLSNMYFSPNDGPSKAMRMFFISVFPSFSSCQPLL